MDVVMVQTDEFWELSSAIVKMRLQMRASSSSSLSRGSSSEREAAARCLESLSQHHQAVFKKSIEYYSVLESTPAERKPSEPGKGKAAPAPGKRRKYVRSGKYEHIHLYSNSGRWGAYYNDPTVTKVKRWYFGTHLTENLAARAQDRAVLMLWPNVIKRRRAKLNFDEEEYAEDKELREKLTKKEFVKLICLESRACYNKVQPTACLAKFLREEEALGHLPAQLKLLECGRVVDTNPGREKLTNKEGKPLAEYMERLIRCRRPAAATSMPPLAWIGKRPRSEVKYYDMITETMTSKARCFLDVCNQLLNGNLH